MSNTKNLTVTYSSISSMAGGVFAHIEQIKPPPILQYASLRDVYQLWLAAATGRSARAIRPVGCPVEFIGTEIHVYLGFYVWPSSNALSYSVSAAQGEITSPAPIRKRREKSYLVDGDTITLPYFLEDIEPIWETPVYNQKNEILDEDPEWISNGTLIRFAASVFGVCRIKGTAVGASYVCEIVFDKEIVEDSDIVAPQETFNTRYMVYDVNGFHSSLPPPVDLNSTTVSNIQNSITTNWIDEKGNHQAEQLRLEIPKCINDVLSFCPGQYMTTEIICREVPGLVVYYNGCTGEAVFTKEKPGPSFCTQIDLQSKPSWLSDSFYDRT